MEQQRNYQIQREEMMLNGGSPMEYLPEGMQHSDGYFTPTGFVPNPAMAQLPTKGRGPRQPKKPRKPWTKKAGLANRIGASPSIGPSDGGFAPQSDVASSPPLMLEADFGIKPDMSREPSPVDDGQDVDQAMSEVM